MTDFDKVSLIALGLMCWAAVMFGGLFYPNTIAGKLAAFVFSIN